MVAKTVRTPYAARKGNILRPPGYRILITLSSGNYPSLAAALQACRPYLLGQIRSLEEVD